MSSSLGIDAVQVADCHIQDFDKKKGKKESVQSIQTAHRLRIIEEWLQIRECQSESIRSNEDTNLNNSLFQGNILDVGCGQGDQTGAIGATIAKYSPSSRVYGLDPGLPDYGAPYTLAKAQKYILDSKLGNWIEFEESGKTKEGLSRFPQGHFTTLTFSHCLWYFDDQQAIMEAFSTALNYKVKNILIAEWSLGSFELIEKEGFQAASFALPHILAALLQAHSPLANINIKCLVSPDQIIQIASKAGWKIVWQSNFSTDANLQDGRWEVEMALNATEAWLEKNQNTNEQEKISIQSHLHALRQSLPSEISQIRCMDVWVCHLVPK